MTHALSVRSLLFAPGDDVTKLTKALRSEADAVIADLEDGVDSGRKQEARACVFRVFADTPRRRERRMVRVNPAERSDLAAIVDLDLDAIVVAKATPDTVAELGPEGPPLVALIETAASVRAAFAIASIPRVAALMLGSLDLSAGLGIPPGQDTAGLSYAASKLVIDSAAAGIVPPFDGVYPNTRNEDGLLAEIDRARGFGFGGKACIHPDQVGTVNRAFASTAAEVAWARSALAVFERAEAGGSAIASLDGEMIDRPVVLRARRIVDLEERRV